MILNLSEKQLRVLETLRSFAREHGYMPSLRELARELSLSYATARQHLDALKKKGFLASDGTAHGLRFLGELAESEAGGLSLEEMAGPGLVPVLGTIAAGAPIEALEVPENPLAVPERMAGGGFYALKVRGTSMVDDHILDGDYVILEPAQTVDDGTIAVALLEDGTATLKRIYREKGRLRLQPANPEMSPVYVKKLRIQGKVRGLLRLLQ